MTRQPTSPALPTEEMREQARQIVAKHYGYDVVENVSLRCAEVEFALKGMVAALAMQAKAPATSLGGVGLVEQAVQAILQVKTGRPPLRRTLSIQEAEAAARAVLALVPDSPQRLADAILDRTPNGEWIAVQYHPNGDWSVANAALAQPTVAVEGLREALKEIGAIDAAANGLTGFAADLVDQMANRARTALAQPTVAVEGLVEAINNARENVDVRRKVGSDSVWLSCDTVETLLAALSQPSSPAEHGPQCSSYMTACQDCLSKFMRWKEAGEPSSLVSSNEDAEWLVSHGKYLKSLIGAGKGTLFFDSDIERLNRIANTLEAKPVDGVTELLKSARPYVERVALGDGTVPEMCVAEATLNAIDEALSLSLKGEGER